MEYKKTELLSSDIYLVDIRFMKNAYANANGMWADMIIKCIRSTDAYYIMNDTVEVPKSLVLDVLKDESVCELWKEKIKEVFNIKESYYYFGNGYKLDTYSTHYPLFVGNSFTPGEEYECLLSNMDKWDFESEIVKIEGTQYFKLKFKKKK